MNKEDIIKNGGLFLQVITIWVWGPLLIVSKFIDFVNRIEERIIGK